MNDHLYDKMKFCESINCNYIEAQLINYNKNFTDVFPPDTYIYTYIFKLDRKIPRADISEIDMKHIPGFVMEWYYNKKVEPATDYRINKDANKEFVK